MIVKCRLCDAPLVLEDGNLEDPQLKRHARKHTAAIFRLMANNSVSSFFDSLFFESADNDTEWKAHQLRLLDFVRSKEAIS
jgi:hypothetical protein